MERRMLGCLIVVTLGLGLVAGCGGSDEKKVETVSVSGTVYLDGTPLEGASIHFTRSLDYEGIGNTGPDGTYELEAEPGQNKVYLSKVEGLTEAEQMEAEMESVAAVGDEGETGPERGQVIPEKYNDPENTILAFDVPAEGTDTADFKLESQ